MLRFASLAAAVTSARTPGRSGTGTRSSASSDGSGVEDGRLRRAALAELSSEKIVARSFVAIAVSSVASRPRSEASPAKIASRLSTQTSGQIAGCPAATRVMSRNPPAASRSRAASLSARSAASFIIAPATRCGTWLTIATSRSWSSADRASAVAPRSRTIATNAA